MLTSFRSDLKPFEELARSFAARELAKDVEERDRHPFGEFSHGLLDKAFEVGFLGVVLPEKQGGIGGGIDTLCVILDAVCRTDSSLGGIIFTNALAHQVILEAGGGALAGKAFRGASSAEDFLVAFPAYSDPSRQDDLPVYTKSGRCFTLTGRVELLVLGGLARRALIPARADSGPSFSFFLVDLFDQRVEKSGPVFTLGLHSCPAVDVRMEGAGAGLIGEEGRGGEYYGRVSAKMHVAAAAMNAGIMKGSLDEALAYSRERFQGGREIIGWSEVAMLLAGMTIKTNVADMCVAQACQVLERGGPGSFSYCISSALHVHEIACETVTDGVQILGGNGYMKDYGQEKRFRDARQVQALLGTVPMRKLGLIRRDRGLE